MPGLSAAPSIASGATGGVEASFGERGLFILLFLAFCSIFTGLEVDAPFIVMRPFDLVCLVVAPLLVCSALLEHRLPRSTGFLLIAAFMLANAAFAFTLGAKNGIRESVQSVELIFLAALLAIYRNMLDWRRMGRWFAVAAVLITVYNIYWHVSNGFMVGWKRLDEPKLLFSYAPPVIFALMLQRQKAGLGAYAILVLLTVLLVFSGERKAQLALMVHMAILCAIGFTRIWVYVLGALAAVPLLWALVLSDPYLQRQFQSVVELGSEQAFTLAEMVDERSGVTQSNGQRLFALEVSEILIAENPLFGVGTNGYQPIVKANYPMLPPHYLLNIHNEFQRILVENGLVGLMLYLLPWLRTLAMAARIGGEQGIRALGIYAIFYVVFFLQCFFEGSGNEAFLAFLMMALMPDFFRLRAGRARSPPRQATHLATRRRAACEGLTDVGKPIAVGRTPEVDGNQSALPAELCDPFMYRRQRGDFAGRQNRSEVLDPEKVGCSGGIGRSTRRRGEGDPLLTRPEPR